MINGEVREMLPATDRALHYGDGLFETVAVVNGQPRLWVAHMARLQRGCEVLGLPVPDQQQLYDEALALCGAEKRAVLKIIYSRGSGGRGYRPPQQATPQRILFRYPWPDYSVQQQGIRLQLCWTPLACNPLLAGIKHLNRLEQVLARAEWDDPDIHEGVMCDLVGQVKEGTMSNLFWVKKGILHTPDLSGCGVAGIMREQVMNLACELGMELVIAETTPQGLTEADEMFVTNSLIGIWPVLHFNGHDYPLGSVTQQLREALHKSLEGGA
jgi:4-amino-4-deoxychorismate lyase